MDKGRQFDIHAAGMLALDVARVEAGLLLIEVDYVSSKKALIPSQKYSPYELGFGKMVHLDKENFIGKRALALDHKQGVARQLVGLEVDRVEVEEQFDKLRTLSGSAAARRRELRRRFWRQARGQGNDDGALAAEEADRAGERGPNIEAGMKLQMELTIEAQRMKTTATVVPITVL